MRPKRKRIRLGEEALAEQGQSEEAVEEADLGEENSKDHYGLYRTWRNIFEYNKLIFFALLE